MTFHAATHASRGSRATTAMVAAGGARGFTLLEVLLAVTIFAMIMVTIVSLLSTGTQTLDRTLARGDLLLRARGTMDVLARDLANVWYMNESDYNVTVRRRLETLEAEARTSRDRDEADRSPRRTGETPEDEYLLPPEIDLSFIGADSDPFDQVSFTTATPNEPGGFWAPWGMRRVQYLVRDRVLYRTEDSVFKENVRADGSIEARPPPEPERVCDRIAYFDLRYRFWYDGEWREAPDWDSSQRRYRFPDVGVTADELGMDEEALRQQRDSESPDDLPSMVVVRLGIEDERREGLIHPFVRHFRIYPAQETHFFQEYRKEWERRGR